MMPAWRYTAKLSGFLFLGKLRSTALAGLTPTLILLERPSGYQFTYVEDSERALLVSVPARCQP